MGFRPVGEAIRALKGKEIVKSRILYRAKRQFEQSRNVKLVRADCRDFTILADQFSVWRIAAPLGTRFLLLPGNPLAEGGGAGRDGAWMRAAKTS